MATAARREGRNHELFAEFLLTQFPESPGGIAAPEEAGSRIVIP